MTISKSTQYLTIASLWFGHFSVDFMLGIWPVYKTLAGLDLALCGLIIGICAFIGEGLQAYFGTLSDRGYRTHLILGGVLLSTASAFLAYSDSYVVLFFLLLLTLIGSGAFHPCAASLVNSLMPKRQGLLMSVFQSGGGAGLAVSQLIFFYAFYSLDGHTFVLAIPIVLFVGLLIINKWVLSAYDIPTPKKKASLMDYADLFKHRELRLLYISQVCNQSLMWGTLFLLPDILLSRGYDTWICFGGGHFAYVAGMTLLLTPIGYLADKYSFKTVVICALGTCIFSLYAFLLLPMLSTGMLLSLLFIFGASLGSITPLNVVYGNRLVPNRSGVVSAFLMGLVWCVSEGLGQFGGGMLTKFFVDDAPAHALGCLGILFLVGLTAYLRLPKELPARTESTC